MGQGERRTGTPVIVRSNGIIEEIPRVPVTEKLLNEAWLQDLIRKQPDVLPVSDIEAIFDPPISIGKEVSTNSGIIDNLFISPEGYLTLVETKLWRNPQSTREVVGQIIDYAKDISNWSFEELDGKVREYNRTYEENNNGIVETIFSKSGSFFSEANLIDLIYKNMKKGRFLLIIVGDGIKESVEEMVDYLNKNPSMLFTLALVELQVFKFSQGDFIVIPQVVTRTQEITRAVVKIEGVNVEKVQIELDTGEETKKPKRRKIDEDEFFEQLKKEKVNVDFVKSVFEDMENLGCKIQWRSQSAMVRLKDPLGRKQKLTIFGITVSGKVFVGWLPDQLEKIGIDRKLGEKFFLDAAKLFSLPDESWEKVLPKINIFEEKYESFFQMVEELIENLKEGT